MTATFSAADAATIAGVTYRQIDHWHRMGFIPAQLIAEGVGQDVADAMAADYHRLIVHTFIQNTKGTPTP